MEQIALSYYQHALNSANQGLKNQKIRQGDYYDKEGLLVCGTCGEKRQQILDFPDPTPADAKHTSPLKTTVPCKCDNAEKVRQIEDEKREKRLKEIAKLKRLSLMDEKFIGASFNALKIDKYNQKNIKLCRRYATAFNEMIAKNQGLLFWGGTGTGKSLAAACIANYLLERKTTVIMTSLVQILEVFDNGGQKASDLIEKMLDADLLILDDLGAERSTPYALEKVYNIVDSRYRKNKPMIVTTNKTLTELQDETDLMYSRTYDRLFEVCYPMQFTGPSRRRQIAHQKYEDMRKLLEE